MTDLAKMSAKELKTLYEHRLRECHRVTATLVRNGRKHDCGLPARQLAADGDFLAGMYVWANDAFEEVVSECERRQRHHGSLKPIKEGS